MPCDVHGLFSSLTVDMRPMVLACLTSAVDSSGPQILTMLGPYESVGPVRYDKNGLVVNTRPDTLTTQDHTGASPMNN